MTDEHKAKFSCNVWTDEEFDKLFDGVRKYGFGRENFNEFGIDRTNYGIY